jgi:Cu2+-exporting ATPase
MIKEKNIVGRKPAYYWIDLVTALLFSLAIFLLCLFYDGCFYHQKIMFYVSLPVFIAGRSIYLNGFKGKINLDTLIATGAFAAFILSFVNTFFPTIYSPAKTFPFVYYEPAVIIISIGLVSKFILQKPIKEEIIIDRKKLEVKEVRILVEEEEVTIPMESLRVDNVVLVKPGEIFPSDGLLLEGVTEVDESFINRASSIRKYPGEQIIGGSLNKTHDVKIKITQTGSDTLASKLIKLVEERNNVSYEEADAVASKYLPLLLLIALLTFVGWIIINPTEGLLNSLRHAFEVLIIGCPCALAIAIPFALSDGHEKLIKRGILVKDLKLLSVLRKVDTLVVDKSGVLTLGKPEVSEVIWKGDSAKRTKLKSILFSIQRKAEDAFAGAVAEYLSKENPEVLPLEEIEEYEGRGVRATIQGETYYIGTDAFIGMINEGRFFKKEEYIIHEISGLEYFFDDEELQAQVHKLKDSGFTVHLAADSKAVFAIIAIGEGIKKSTTETMRWLKQKNIDVVLMTSDSKESAESLGEKLKLKSVHSEVLPLSKASMIADLQKKGKVVAFAGGGIEDGPALTQSNAAFVLVSGNDVAVENSDAVLLDGDISKISEVIEFSNSIRKVIKTNLLWALLFNIIGVVIATGITVSITGLLLTSASATLLMSLGILGVVLNNLKVKNL